MTARNHHHPINPRAVSRARKALLGPPEVQRLGRLVALLADPLRIQVLFALSATSELCVGDVALALRVTDDQASYALRQFRTAGLLEIRREGRVIYYRLAEGFPHQLLELCLGQLLSITAQEGRHHVDRH